MSKNYLICFLCTGFWKKDTFEHCVFYANISHTLYIFIIISIFESFRLNEFILSKDIFYMRQDAKCFFFLCFFFTSENGDKKFIH